ncbi:MAG: flagellin [Cycloclasticus sp.]|nr:flagellin [Cycloclasticus sp.]
MPQFINTNVPSLTAQRNLNTSQGALNTSLERLSSGLRINSAKDDAAGLGISERFTAQINGLNQAQRNANDGISLAQTAEGDLAAIGNNLQRIRELSVQSANATNSASDRAALQAEVSQLTSEINRVAEQSSFNSVNLLDGSFTAQNFQVGANAGETVAIASIVDARTSQLGSHTLVADGTVTGDVVASATVNGIAAETDLTIKTDAGTTSPISYAISSGADDIATAINAAAGSLGVTATASNSTTISSLSGPGTVTFDLIGDGTGAISAVVTDQNDLSELVNAINGVTGTTGITATFTDSSSNAGITLSTTDGGNIAIDGFAVTGVSNETVSFGGSTLTEGGTVDSIKTGTIELVSTQGAITTAGADATVFASAGANNSSFTSVAALDISTAAGATAALSTVDSALSQVNSGRAELGAAQNRFDSVVSSIQTTSENLAASRSRIRDTDFAEETAALTRAQILQQAGTSMLSQANSLPQGVLALLQ